MAVDNRVTGVMGLCIFGCLALLSLVRLSLTLCRHGLRPMTPHKRFYSCVLVFSACDVPRYVMMAWHDRALEDMVGTAPRVAYALHLVSMWMQVVGVTVVIVMWSSVFQQQGQPARGSANSTVGAGGPGTPATPGGGTFAASGASGGARNTSGGAGPGGVGGSGGGAGADSGCCGQPLSWWFFALVNVLLLTNTGVVCYELLHSHTEEPLNKALMHSTYYNPFVVTVSACLLVCATGILAYGAKVHWRITSHSWHVEHRIKIRKLLRRLNWTMSVCSLCFALRIVMLLLLFNSSVANNKVFPEFTWHALSYWIPTAVPAVLLLYLMRGPGPQRGGAGKGGGGGAGGASVGRGRGGMGGPIARGSMGGHTSGSDAESRRDMRQPLTGGIPPSRYDDLTATHPAPGSSV